MQKDQRHRWSAKEDVACQVSNVGPHGKGSPIGLKSRALGETAVPLVYGSARAARQFRTGQRIGYSISRAKPIPGLGSRKSLKTRQQPHPRWAEALAFT